MAISEQHSAFDQSDRVNKILEVILAYAALDFSRKTEVLGTNDVFDAIGAGVNMLGEELEESTVSLKEKEYLLKEVHHRVKNNLQIVSSLLSLQSQNVTDPRFLEMVEDCKTRINSMSLVHEMLCASRDLSKIEIGEYICRLSNSICSSLARPNSQIGVVFESKNKAFFEVDLMIPIGLIINEIICNSIKYAFPADEGLITINLNSQPEGKHQLHVNDNGIGLPDNFNPEKDANLGIQLIMMLVKQIGGTLEMKKNNGTHYSIYF